MNNKFNNRYSTKSIIVGNRYVIQEMPSINIKTLSLLLIFISSENENIIIYYLSIYEFSYMYITLKEIIGLQLYVFILLIYDLDEKNNEFFPQHGSSEKFLRYCGYATF